MNNTNNDSISLENQDIISNIDDYLLPQLKKAQQQYEEEKRQKKLEDEAWEKRYDKAKGKFNKRSEDMLGMIKPLVDLNKFKPVATLYIGILFLLWVISPFNFEGFIISLSLYGIAAFFILCIIYFPLDSLLYKQEEQRKERTRKELEEIKKREYPILFERKPSFGHWEAQNIYTKTVHENLKERYPQFDYLINVYESDGFSRTIDKFKEVRYLLNSGRAQTYEDATRMMWDYLDEKWDLELEYGKTSGYVEEKGPARVYQENREESASEMYTKQRAAESDVLHEEWLKEHYKKGQENLDREIRGQLEHAATHARQWGNDRQTARQYDDQLGRSYHERLEEDRKYGYGEDDKMSDLGGDLK
ncbi:hypothetical protein BCJMU51_4434 [Bacillus cereus]|uniref:hypothetical protein n=1 Tax=Bacillus cereus TaxID=1396 RepID=UPI001F245BFE|nr:hypothetical protein [Bacillus cereus]BCB39515.1 hypothetical protein BCM0045_4410 [Bacillus cereus]BCC02356.1 hypothetical protein BCM0057_4438 [Bacillus cereus]BCC25868.1 hypothetical protein BCM0079_4461 [Bacillus cereus]BCC37436.1 hypothetical protein BCM0105_4426 [Bacillus cereus]BCC43238.1 hypothetical protein BCJMU01_4405 [Bacillus cereus]